MMANPRIPQLQDQIREFLAQFLQRRVKDPRLGFVTITDVRLTGDAREASVFYTVYGEEADATATKAALESAKGLLRSELGKHLGMKFVPSLTFIPDATGETAADMEDLLAQARARDAELAAGRAQAQYAGDADPYKHKADESDDA
jgi:ribosome-binding factor A